MKITPKNKSQKFSLPLKIFESVHIADAISKDGEEFSIFVGLEKRYVEQLKKLSLDEKDLDLQKNTRDRKRFGENPYEDWYGKNRTPFCLIHKQTDALAALVWLGPEPLFSGENNWHTIGWRSYGAFRGKGIMKNFTQFAIDVYTRNFPDITIWCAIKRGNAGSSNLATTLGFQISEETSDDASLVMIK
ncbi:hypothetical protein A2121_03225 [Candidatus Nomurabacteria bacterium GWB1_40_6]|uniref:N-acetyltransferase domain-containing protein n=1 Tax=Candidatus Nomurabacteria bacterium GWB1_40_6 TaxID=1801727 RepID=A0A1F6TKF7_9BACT|nr:MAG: hypothetical protein A2121_03225 [Candidatus Nomurabacteria bacterium GWB1_40_6]